MNFPKISIVVPSYNQGQYLEETLVSIISQQYPGLELFVVDGGSTDNSIDIIRKYENHINWWVSEKDRGQSDAINKGLHKVTGDIITWINSDDMLMPEALHKVAGYFQELPNEVGLVHGGITLFENGKDLGSDWGYSDPSIERNLSGMAFSQPSAFFRKKYLDDAGGQLREDLHYGMDYDLFSRLACVCRFAPVGEILAKYRLHQQSKSIAHENKFISDWNRVFINLCKNFGWNDILEEMKKLGFFENEFSYYYPFSFQPHPGLVSSTDRKKVLFYHLCYVLKSFYWHRQIKEAREIARYLKKNYSRRLLYGEKAINPILIKIVIPRFIMNIARDIRRKLRRL